MKWGLALALLFVFAPTWNVNAASIKETDECTILLEGEIDKFTDADLAARYKSMNGGKPDKCQLGVVHLWLNSNGGDVEAAMRAGEFVRQKKIYTGVGPHDNTCASACVLLLVGGVKRTVFGKIGLHRPFLDKYSNSETESRTEYEKNNRLILKYLARMNITESLLKAMNSVSPGEIRWITIMDDKELSELNITGEDPVYADERDSANAKKWGISKKEYYLRLQRIETVCGDGRDASFLNNEATLRYGKCMQDVLSGRR